MNIFCNEVPLPSGNGTVKMTDTAIPRIRVTDVARLMGVSEQTIRVGLQQDLFPWGKAVKTSKNRYTYIINANKFAELEGIALYRTEEETAVESEMY